MNFKEYFKGMKLSMPVFLGYFSVSFGFGALAATEGLSALQASIMSISNLTSAGQFAGLTAIVASAPLIELIVGQLVINSRYALMGVALSQKMGIRIGVIPRLIISFFNTDEVFAIMMSRDKPLTTSFMLGLGILPLVGWTSGTFFGAVAGSILPASVSNALGVALYGMFIAIVIPQAKLEHPKLVAMLTAVALACAFKWLPLLSSLSGSTATIICTVIAAVICAILFPIADGDAEESEGEA